MNRKEFKAAEAAEAEEAERRYVEESREYNARRYARRAAAAQRHEPGER